MTIKVNRKDGSYSGNPGVGGHTEIITALATQAAKQKAEGVAALTDNSGGDATPTANKVQSVAAFVAVAASGSSLAGKATTETALGKIKDAVTELATKTNAFCTVLGLPLLTDSSGGAGADGTIAALDQTVTGATTGAQITETNAIRLVVNDAFNELALKVNKIAYALDLDPVVIDTTFAAKNGTIAAIGTGTGTAADPGITKVAMDAALVKWADNVAYLAAKLNEFRAAAPLKVVVV